MQIITEMFSLIILWWNVSILVGVVYRHGVQSLTRKSEKDEDDINISTTIIHKAPVKKKTVFIALVQFQILYSTAKLIDTGISFSLFGWIWLYEPRCGLWESISGLPSQSRFRLGLVDKAFMLCCFLSVIRKVLYNKLQYNVLWHLELYRNFNTTKCLVWMQSNKTETFIYLYCIFYGPTYNWISLTFSPFFFPSPLNTPQC